MEQYAQILIIASPLFFVFVMIEKLYGKIRFGDDFRAMDIISSLSSGLTNTLKDVLGIGVSIISYSWLVDKVALTHIELTWVNVLIAFIALDLSGYIGHRINHSINFFWNQHLIHHSSEEFNLACALRQSISNLVGFFTIFLIPAALLGVDVKIIGIVAPLHLFAQFWYHTIYIGKLGFLEKIIVTPSHHRVHHAINPIYIDKNHGQIFIIWDKLFGTFQEELDDVPPVYGITIPVSTWNPIKINFQQWWMLLQDSFRTKNWWDKFRLWFMPTGWRPSDVESKYPVAKIEDPYNFEKFYPKVSSAFTWWSWFQFFAIFGLLLYLFSSIAKHEIEVLLVYGGYIYLCIYALTEAMDKNKNAIWIEIAKNAIGFGIFFYFGSWFGIESLNPVYEFAVLAYFIVSSIGTLYFHFKEITPQQSAMKFA
ncbi:Fatty acid hydroxylase superfamily protein [Spirosomataceae bacterium TFI 002]|nr:Fatty acid hydroxylase superfamily protein [Spirosomataceae bacterium TFI 002]